MSGKHQKECHHTAQYGRISLEAYFQRHRTCISENSILTNHMVTPEPRGLDQNKCHHRIQRVRFSMDL